MKNFFIAIPFIISIFQVSGQSLLKPTIGVLQLPGDNDSVCYIPMFSGSFYTSGLQAGDTASDFKLFNLTGDSIVLSSVLSSGKPALVIAGSYTCPVFRNKVGNINNVFSLYGNQVEVMIVYTIEAHPDVDTSVYFGYVNTGSQNINAGILYRQPVTYGERKQVVDDMLGAMIINVPVYLDGPCNNWWNHYGPAPNNAYLIDTNGIIFAKHGWYDKFPENIICDIDSLLGNPVICTSTPTNGSFTFNLLSNDTISGAPGSTITFAGELVNTSSQDVIVDLYRLINNLPAGWGSSLCADVCYPTTTDSASILIPAGMIQHFYFYIYTDSSIDTARTRVGFRNRNFPSNQFMSNLIGITEQSTDIVEQNAYTFKFDAYPNPATDIINLEVHLFQPEQCVVKFFDANGKLFKMSDYGKLPSGRHLLKENTICLPNGFYFLVVETNNPMQTRKLIINR